MARLIAGLVALGVETAAAAQHPMVLERLRAANVAAPQPSADVIAAEVANAAKKLNEPYGCPTPGFKVVDVAAATGTPLVFGPIVRGQFRNAWTVTATCGADLGRYTMIQLPDGHFQTFRTNLGRSLASETLIADTLKLATLQAVATIKRAGTHCDLHPETIGTLGITRIVKEEPGLGPDVYGVRYIGSWEEVWPIHICMRTVEVTIRFTADGDSGAMIDIPGAKAKLQQP